MMYLEIEPEKDGGPKLSSRVADALRNAILQGRFKVGEKLPSNRQLASVLSISRQSVNLALKELRDEGYLSIDPRSGTKVRKRKFREMIASGALQSFHPVEVQLSDFSKRLMAKSSTIDSSTPGAPAVSLLPAKKWYRLSSEALRKGYEHLHEQTQHRGGLIELRKAISRYLRRTKDIACSPEQVFIVPNMLVGKDLLFRLLTNPGDLVVLDEPCSNEISVLAEQHGVAYRYAFTDRQGVVVQALSNAAEEAKFITVQTRNPISGKSISPERINQLLTWAGATSTVIVETDVAYEFQAGARSGPAIMANDRDDSVIYISDFSGSLAPLTSCAFVVFPEKLVSTANLAVQSLVPDTSFIEQYSLSRLIDSGYLERWNTKIKTIYANKRAKLVHALTINLQEYIEIESVNSPLTVLVRFDELNGAEDIQRVASTCGLVLHHTQRFYPSADRGNEFSIDVASIHERDIAVVVRNFAIELLALRSTALVAASRSFSPAAPAQNFSGATDDTVVVNDYLVSKMYPTP